MRLCLRYSCWSKDTTTARRRTPATARERTEQMDDDRLNEIVKALGVTADVIKNFSEQTAINIVSGTLHDNAGSVFYNPTFNPINKIVELYERMLKEKNELIEKLMKERK